ncbi:DUF4065 domain-containing protein [Halosegnis longus]|jgi:uncharacterized protein YwgA|uniref:DUF4065 domain-containing protein n=2 Tax=Halobacteria TaxID=183963 RepID=A0AAJ4R6N3_9EURY|nr:DUF4065 domain-containing protein [Salella cibi]
MMIDRQLIPLTLLHASNEQEIEGRTRLQKMVFLIQQEFEERGEDLPGTYQYEPYDYGPFAKTLYDDIEYLEERDIIDESKETIAEEDGKVKYNYELGPRGEEILQEWPEEQVEIVLEVAERIKSDFNDIPLLTLLDHVYSEYPKYAENSVL